MKLEGSKHSKRIFKTENVPGITNYFLAHIPKSITGNKSYYRAVSNDVYNKIDMQTYSNNNGVKFYFIVRPGGNADDIIMRFDGADAVNVTPDGGLEIVTSIGKMKFDPGHAYQVNPGGNIVPMPWQANFIALGSNKVKFDIRNYPQNMPLFIQVDKGHTLAFVSNNTSPEWSQYFGGIGYDEGTDVAIDSDGNPYFVGWTSSPDFPTPNGIFVNYMGGGADAYFAKFGSAIGASSGVVPDADKKLWVTYYGGSASETPNSIAVTGDGTSGKFYVTGWTQSPDFPIYYGGFYFQTSLSGIQDAFIVVLDNLTGGINASTRWATYFGGSGYDEANGIAKDDDGNTFIAGETYSNFYAANLCDAPSDSGFPQCNSLGASSYTSSYGGGNTDAFIAKFNLFGQLIWSTFLGGSGNDVINDIAIFDDDSYYYNNVLLVTGTTTSNNDFPLRNYPQWSDYNQDTFGGGNYDAFVAKFFANGFLGWNTFYGGSGDDVGLCIATSPVAYPIFYIGGYTSSSTPACNSTQCLCNVPPTGQFPLCRFYSTDYFQGINDSGIYGGGLYDGFIAGFTVGGEFRKGTYYGGSGEDKITGLAMDNANRIFFTGITNTSVPSVNLNQIGPNSWYYNQSVFGGFWDGLIGHFSTGFTRLWSSYFGGNSFEIIRSIAVISSGASHFWYITGSTSSPDLYRAPENDSSMFICCPNAYLQSYTGNKDALIARFSFNDVFLSVENFTQDESTAIQVYPNPASYYVTVSINLNEKNDVFLNLYTIYGQKIFDKYFENIYSNFSVPLDFSTLKSGIYLLQIKTGKNVIIKKIIRHH